MSLLNALNIPIAQLSLPPFIDEYLGWIAAGLIVVIGLFVLGFGDVTRFSFKRVWAISSVNFTEAVRKRVLWVTPLAIIGVIIVSQLQHPSNAQEAIRQTIRFSLFATGLVVSIVAIILACTNLPKEIESRVIYTVVTKPTTRLEIVAGKVLGFARVSALILLVMGFFAWGYLQFRAWDLQRNITEQLRVGLINPAQRQTLEYFSEHGLLHSKETSPAQSVSIYGRMPQPGDKVRWMNFGEQDYAIAFKIEPTDLVPNGDLNQPLPPVAVIVKVRAEARTMTSEEIAEAGDATRGFGNIGTTESILRITPSTQEGGPRPQHLPRVLVEVTNLNLRFFAEDLRLNQSQPVELPPQALDDLVEIPIRVPENLLRRMAVEKNFAVTLTGAMGGYFYGVPADAIRVAIAQPDGTARFLDTQSSPLFRGREGRGGGMQLRGSLENQSIAMIDYKDVPIQTASGGMVPFEMRVSVERSGETDDTGDDVTNLSLEFHNRTNQHVETVTVQTEANLHTFFTVPAKAVEGGNFVVYVRNNNLGHWVSLFPGSIRVVTGSEPFIWNLFKSLLVLWMMSVLIVTIAIFCSTFLSWPIAIVLTIVILLGHWGVSQLGDSLGSGIGNQVATEMGFSDPSKARVVSEVTEAMARALNIIGSVLPDISQFDATSDLTQGRTLPARVLLSAAEVAAGFGLPLLVLGYVFLKRKEVAP